MVTLTGVVVGAATGWALWWGLRPVLDLPLFARGNHRGAAVPTAGGLVIPLTTLPVAASVALLGTTGLLELGPVDAHAAVLAAAGGLALLGLVDDLAGTGHDGRGFRGHLRALAGGRVTTGGLKLLGGGALALVVCAPVSGGGTVRLVADALLVALAANVGNLLDRAPGRSIKVAALSFAVLAVGTGLPDELAGAGVVVGAALALLPADLRERVMLGDTGANAIGGVIGLGVVVATTPATRLSVLAVVVVLNVAGEMVSFSRIIDEVAPLRALDRVGRRREN